MFNSVDGKPDLRNIRFELDQAIKSVYGEMLTMLIEAEMDAHIGAGKWGRVSAEELPLTTSWVRLPMSQMRQIRKTSENIAMALTAVR